MNACVGWWAVLFSVHHAATQESACDAVDGFSTGTGVP
jgi:hypothetical protein